MIQGAASSAGAAGAKKSAFQVGQSSPWGLRAQPLSRGGQALSRERKSPTWMTRSGLAAATLAANDANGHRAGMLQSWNLPCSSSSASALADRFPAFRRQPVSPNAATDLSVGLKTGSGKFSMRADLVPAASGNSHTSTGNA